MRGLPPEWVTLCRAVGTRAPWWTQGAGGNVSVKDAGSLWIKASGQRLDAASPGQAIAKLALGPFLQALAQPALSEADYALALQHFSDATGGRASMESGFHALLPERVVLHFHPVSALVMARVARTTPRDWEAFCDAQGCPVPPCIAPTPPGLALSRAVARHARHAMFLLENHGVVLQGSDAGVLATWTAFEAAFCRAWHIPGAHFDTPLDEVAMAAGPWRVYTPDAIVFADRVRAILVAWGQGDPADAAYRLLPDARARDKCAWEIWIATQLARAACPDLPEWPASMAEALHTLPMEAWRRRHAGRSETARGGDTA